MNYPELAIRVPVLLGPTAVGKTHLAIEVARTLDLEVLSCDSRQIYRHMDIGTAKPTPEQLARIPHHLIDILDPDEAYSVHRFAVDAAEVIRARQSEGKGVMLCGGTGLYFKGLSEGLRGPVEANEEFRRECEQRVLREGPKPLHAELTRRDPQTAARLHPNDTQRVIRALDVVRSTGLPLSSQPCALKPPSNMTFSVAVLCRQRNDLYERINQRVARMFREGLWEEFLLLRRDGYNRGSPGMACVGYQELFDVEEGRCTIAEAQDRICRNTRRYAKRQITWFSHQVKAETFDVSDGDILKNVKTYFERFLNTR